MIKYVNNPYKIHIHPTASKNVLGGPLCITKYEDKPILCSCGIMTLIPESK